MIPIAPAPQWSDAAAFIAAAVCAVAGLTMLLWGRRFARALPALLAGGAAYFAAGLLADHVSIDPLILSLSAAGVLAVIAFLAARVIWALLGGVIGGAVAAAAMLVCCLDRLPAESVPASIESAAELGVWGGEVARFTGEALLALGQANLPLVLAVMCPAVVGPVVLLAMRPGLARVVMTSLLGAAALVGGPVITAAQLRQDWWVHIWSYPLIPVAVWALLATFSLVHQGRAAAAAKGSGNEGEDDDEEDESSEVPPPEKKKSRKKT